MTFDWFIIDGYNLLHQNEIPGKKRDDLQKARQRLVRRIERTALGMAPRISVVFDGRERGRDAAWDSPHLEVLFSPANQTADTLIERMVSEAKKPERILVITSDHIEAQVVSASGASVLSSQEFIRQCDASEGVPTIHRTGKTSNTGPKLGDFFPMG